MEYVQVQKAVIDELRFLVEEIDDVCSKPWTPAGCEVIDKNELRIKEIIRNLVNGGYIKNGN
jgi:hypothetical protein